jgi:cytoskeleton protein RodZ
MQDKPKKQSGGKSGRQTGQYESVEATADTSMRAAREALGLSLDEVAHDLHLSRDVVLALEEGDHERLGAPVFVRGHLRSYAKLLGLPENEVVRELDEIESEPEEFRTLSAQKEVKPGASLPNFVLWMSLVAVIVIAVVYLMLGDAGAPPDEIGGRDFSTTIAPEPAPPEMAEPEQAEAAAEAMPADLAPDAVEQTVGGGMPAEPAVAAAVVAAPATATVQAPEAPPVAAAPIEATPIEATPIEAAPTEAPPVAGLPTSLTLRFTEECWVEVSDAQRRLLYGLEKPGAEVQLEGEPPFRIFLGHAAGVTLELNGSPYEIPRSANRAGKTARFGIYQADLPQ